MVLFNGNGRKREPIDEAIRQIDLWSDRVIRVVFLLILLVGSYISYDMWYVYSRASTDQVGAFKPDEITDDSLAKISKNAIGWLELDDTNIDYPIMQGEDNVEYLNKGPDGEYNLAGSIFLDFRNDKNFLNNYSILYGHHMSKGYMFGALDKFKEKKYFYSHRTGKIRTGKMRYNLKVIGIIITDASADEVFDTEIDDNAKRVAYFKSVAMHWDDDGKGRIVALTTCKEPLTTARTALICRITERE